MKNTMTFSMALLMLGALACTDTEAANKFRVYDFEGGTPGMTTGTLQDAIAGQTVIGTNGADGLLWLEVPGDTPRPLPAGGAMDVVDANALDAPALANFLGQGSYVDVSDGTSLDSPAPNSSVALSFDGFAAYDDLATGGGSRGVYVDTMAYDNNDPIAGGTNTFESFSILTQGWVRPDSSAMGVEQTVYQIGGEHGAPTITSDGFWKLASVGTFVPGGEFLSNEAVKFDQWSHVAVFRTGNNVQMFVNGNLVAGDPDSTDHFFNSFANVTSVGADAFGSTPFTGLIDDFTMSGFADTTFDLQTDVDFFATVTTELIINQQTGEVTLRNNGTEPFVFDQLALTSSSGALNAAGWSSISDNYDADSGGTLDMTDNWMVTSLTNALLAEEESPSNDGATLAAGQEVSLGNAWFRSPIRELGIELTLLDDQIAPVLINYVDDMGNPADPIAVGDLDFEGTITLDDWNIFIQNMGSLLENMGPAESYGFGDFDGDLDVDIDDFQTFVAAFDAANGAGAFAESIPEPSAGLLALIGLLMFGRRRS